MNDAPQIPGYRLLRELGRGGMAVVYLAEQQSLGREVALKLLNPVLAQDPDFAERFLREARIAGGFRHRHLISIVDAGQAGGQLYLAMEYVPNGNAGDLRGGPPAVIRRCLLEVAAGLHYAHGKGVVHRDLKPENILRREDGSFVLSDFGIARPAAATREITGPQAAIGTPSYMSPEQWRGERVDHRADLYALGVVLYELLTGQTPFRGEDGWSIGMQHMQAPRPKLPKALADWQAILDHLLAVDREQRFQDANQLIAALGGQPETTPQQTPVVYANTQAMATTPLPLRQTRRRFTGIAALVLLALLGVFALLKTPAPAPKPTATVPAPASTIASKSVAVMPFEVLSQDPADALFADGLSEEILSSLAAIPELKVPGRTSSFAWKDKATDVRAIGAALGVAHLLEGSIRRAGKRLRITASLLSVTDGRALWSESFDHQADDVFDIQGRVALAVADRLSARIGTRVLPTLARLPSAQRANYLQNIGGLQSARADQVKQHLAALTALAKAHEVGPDLYVRLIHWQAQLARWGAVPYAQAIAEQTRLQQIIDARFADSIEARIGRAIALNSRADASNLVADYEMSFQGFKDLLGEVPNDALVATQAAFGARTLLKFEEAIVLARRALAIEPEDPNAHFVLALALGSAGRGDDAVAVMKNLAERFPESREAQGLALFLAGNGQLADAVLVERACIERPPDWRCGQYIRLLDLLGFSAQAERDLAAARRRLPADAGLAGFAALRAGQLPDEAYAARGPFEFATSMTEAYAQGQSAKARAYLDRGQGYFNLNWWRRQVPARDLDMRAAMTYVFVAISDLGDEQPAFRAQSLAEVAAIARRIPLTSMPYPTVSTALGAEILSGDLDAAMARMQAQSQLNPLNWQGWVESPSGREMPTAAALRADPRFDAIWAARADLLKRERERLLRLWPELANTGTAAGKPAP